MTLVQRLYVAAIALVAAACVQRGPVDKEMPIWKPPEQQVRSISASYGEVPVNIQTGTTVYDVHLRAAGITTTGRIKRTVETMPIGFRESIDAYFALEERHDLNFERAYFEKILGHSTEFYEFWVTSRAHIRNTLGVQHSLETTRVRRKEGGEIKGHFFLQERMTVEKAMNMYPSIPLDEWMWDLNDETFNRWEEYKKEKGLKFKNYEQEKGPMEAFEKNYVRRLLSERHDKELLALEVIAFGPNYFREEPSVDRPDDKAPDQGDFSLFRLADIIRSSILTRNTLDRIVTRYGSLKVMDGVDARKYKFENELHGYVRKRMKSHEKELSKLPILERWDKENKLKKSFKKELEDIVRKRNPQPLQRGEQLFVEYGTSMPLPDDVLIIRLEAYYDITRKEGVIELTNDTTYIALDEKGLVALRIGVDNPALFGVKVKIKRK